MWLDAITARRRGKQLFMLLVNTGVRNLGNGASVSDLTGQHGAGGGVESASTFSILSAALPVPYYWRLRGVNGIKRPRGLWGLLAKQSWKANNCFKVNNNWWPWYPRQEVHVCAGLGWSKYSLFLQLMFNLWVAHMTPASLGLYSGLMLRNVEGGGVKGFSRMHKEMNRGCRPMPIRLYHSATRNLPWVSLDFVNEPLLIYSARAADR